MDHKPTRDNKRKLVYAMRRGMLTPPEVAAILQISRASAYRMAAGIDLAAARALYVERQAYTLLVGKFESKATKSAKAAELIADYQANPTKRIFHPKPTHKTRNPCPF